MWSCDGADPRGGDRGQDAAEDVVDRDVSGQGLVGEHEAVAEDVGGHVVHVLGQHVGPTTQQGERPAGGDQAEARHGGWRRTRGTR